VPLVLPLALPLQHAWSVSPDWHQCLMAENDYQMQIHRNWQEKH